MTHRFKQLTTAIQLTGIASLMLFVGATTPRPVVKTIPAAKVTVVAPIAKAADAAPDELLHDAVIASATLPASSASITHKLRIIRMEVTAYCPCTKCCGENAQGLTASGHDISYNNSRFVAADTDRLPFGTKLVIPGYAGGAVEVIDRGGAIKGNKLDVFFPTHEEALQWGRQWIDVTVLE